MTLPYSRCVLNLQTIIFLNKGFTGKPETNINQKILGGNEKWVMII